MVGRGHIFGVITHQVRHNYTDSFLLVVQHDRFTAARASAQLKRPLGIFTVEGLTLQACEVIDVEVAVIEEHDMRRGLPGHSLADGTVASVIVDGIAI